jgi:hypothetical protein
MKIAIQILSLTVFIGFIAGCSTTAPPTGYSSDKAWYRADASADELRRDLAQCQYEALLTRRTTSVYGNTLGQTILLKMVADSSEDSKENQMVASCMSAKGYTLVSKKSPLLSKLQDNQTFQLVDSKELSSQLVGHWESTKMNGAGVGDGVSRMTLDIFNNNRLITTTIQNGQVYSLLNRYGIMDGNIYLWNAFERSPKRSDGASYTFSGNQLTINQSHDFQVVFSKTILDGLTNSVIIGKWKSENGQMEMDFLPDYRYRIVVNNSVTDGIYYYNERTCVLYCLQNDEAKPEACKFYIVGNSMNCVVKGVTIRFNRE